MNVAVGIVLLFGVLTISVAEDGPKVCIEDGCLFGIQEVSRYNRTFNSFLGVPYAKPPLGELRFEAPQKPDSWNTLEAKKDGNICIQVALFQKDVLIGSEDCLYLNVFTPRLPNEGTQLQKLPVMVYFHPGCFMFWAGTRDYFPANFLMDRDIVLVTVNYRLSILGFLSTGDDVVPGNWGLKDQVHALRWVRQNIASFGGDPDSVTIFGNSAGGSSVHYHMLSPLSNGLFHRAIAQSGTVVARWAYTPPAKLKKDIDEIGKRFGCSTKNSTVLVQCLRGIPAEKLIANDECFDAIDTSKIKWSPTAEPIHEGAFVTESPRDLLKEGRFTDVPFMIGTTLKEGLLRIATMFASKMDKSFETNVIEWLTNILYFRKYPEEIAKAVKKIQTFYFNDRKITQAEEENVIDIITDYYFLHPVVHAIELQRKYQRSPIFTYSFEFKANTTFAPVFGYKVKNELSGPCHVDDMLYLFPQGKAIFKNSSFKRTIEEEKMIDRMLDLWTNFAKYSNPTPQNYDVVWEPVKSKEHECLVIGGPRDLRMLSNYNSKQLTLWDELNLDRETHEYINP